MRSKSFAAGVRAAIPIMLGFLPVAFAYAASAAKAGFTLSETVFMSATVFAGASQMMAVGMYEPGIEIITIVVATLLINLRHIIMSTCVFNKIDKTNIFLRIIAAYGVTDETFAVFTTNENEKYNNVWYLFGLNISAYLAWVIGGAIGSFVIGYLPEFIRESFGIAMPAMFIALIMPSVKKSKKLALLVLITAAANSVLNIFLARSYSIIISTLVCALIGVFFVDDFETGTSAKKPLENAASEVAENE